MLFRSVGSTSFLGTASPVQAAGVTMSNKRADLAWSAPLDLGGGTLVGYRIEYSANAGVSWSQVQEDNVGTGASILGLTNGTLYQFRITALTTQGAGTPVVVTGTPWTTPSAPTSIRATASDRTITVNWSAPAENGGLSLSGYQIDVCTASCATTTNWTTYVRSTGSASTTSYTFTEIGRAHV